MVNMPASRIMQEFKEEMTDEIVQSSIKIELVNDSWREGVKFVLEINVPETYPFHRTKVRFITRIWHPNISVEDGEICLYMNNWFAGTTLRTLLLSLQALLAAPQSDDVEQATVHYQFNNTPEIFLMNAKHWTNAYAGGPHSFPDYDSKVQRLKDMGVLRVFFQSHTYWQR
ncbi:ubiquitin-conjugating enzyme E2-22 kDa-like [Scaptodrosophila lebanonensis]|uniref:Ubiquitin-conjugating enzyme E2-22 kDa-like n=1 Tax=Drosophila lebanonensis TaxID=7225 RepID=A0A6J2UJ12_DROLE|nr:ubiquitin-conjugating enzyme E2-22 kDa-like [Scaptodrosophila lebanonensis]